MCSIRLRYSAFNRFHFSVSVDSFSDVPSSQSAHESSGKFITLTSSPDPSADVSPPEPAFRWDYILAYVLLVSMKGPGGYLTAIRNVLWIKVHQHAAGNLRIALFEHLHRSDTDPYLMTTTVRTRSMKNENCHDDNFVVTGGTEGCRYDAKPCCHRWRQCWCHFQSNNTVLFPKYSHKTPYSLPTRARYGLYFVSSKAGLSFTPENCCA